MTEILDTIDIPEAPAIDGLRFRHYRAAADHEAMADLNTVTRAANGMVEVTTAAQIANDYPHLQNCDLERDWIGVELEGRLVGYGRTYWADRNEGTRGFTTVCFLDPDARRRGIGAALLAAQLRRLDELVAAHPAERPMVYTSFSFAQDVGARILLEANGYSIDRRESEMVRPGFEGIPDLPLPDGLEIRPIDPADSAMIRRVFEAGSEIFRAHWGDNDESEDAFEAFIGGPEFNPRLWRVAFDGDEIAGHILNYLEPRPDGAVVGWTESIGVRRPYRRRGLARALLAESLRTVRDAGADYAALGVDTKNENHALDLYESLGFQVRSDAFQFLRLVQPDDPQRLSEVPA